MRRHPFLALFTMLSILSLAQEGHAGGSGLSKEAERVARMTVNPEFKFDVIGRRAFALALSDYCTAMLSWIPNNPPDEQQWAESEANTSDPSKILRLLRSAEWARYQLKDKFVSCQTVAGDLKQIQASSDYRREALSWLILAQIFNSDANLIAYGERVSVDPEKRDLSLERLPGSRVDPKWNGGLRAPSFAPRQKRQ